MSFIGSNPKWKTGGFTPQSADPTSPREGDVFRSDGTSREKGLWEYKNSAWVKIGSGSGIQNYISNGSVQTGITGWFTYADAAGVAPVDGTGGSPTVTFAANTSSPLRGVADFVFTKDAANRQGEGVGYAFTIDSADQSRVLNVSVDFKTSANYVDGYMRVYLYDVTNAIVIEPVGVSIYAYGGTGSSTHRATFQTSAASTSYRLIFHVSSTSASAYTINMVNVIVGTQNVSSGSIITDWTSFTPTGSWSSNTTYTGKFRRIGDSAQYDIKVATSGAPTSATLTVNLPSGHTIDTSKLSDSTAGTYNLVPGGISTTFDSGTKTWTSSQVSYSSTTAVQPLYDVGDGSAAAITQAAPMTFANGDIVKLSFILPIAGWSSNTTMSEDAGNTLIASKAVRASGDITITSGGVELLLNSVIYDKSNSYNAATGRFTAPETGYYDVSYGLNVTTGTTTTTLESIIYINGTGSYYGHWVSNDTAAGKTVSPKGSDVVYLTKGQYVSIFVYAASANATLNAYADSRNFFNVSKRSSPQTIAASEKCYAAYSTNNYTTCVNATYTTIIFEDKIVDSHNAYNTSNGIFTCPRSGILSVSAALEYYNSAGWEVAEFADLEVLINSTRKAIAVVRIQATGSFLMNLNGSLSAYPVNKGDTVKIITYQNSGVNINLNGDTSFNHVEFKID